MGKVKFSAAVSEIRNKVGDVVYSRNRYGAYIRDYVIPTDPNTTRQQAIRSAFAGAQAQWQTLSSAIKLKFDQLAKTLRKTDIYGSQYSSNGMQFFIQLCMELNVAGLSALTDTPVLTPAKAIQTLSFTINPDTDEFFVTTTCTGSFTGNTVIIRATPILSNGINFFKKKFRVIWVSQDNMLTNFDLWSTYVAMFGTPNVGDRIALEAYSINNTSGLRSQGISSFVDVVSSWDPDALAYFAECATQPGNDMKLLYNALIVSLKAGSNNWAKIVRMFSWAAEYEDNALTSIVNPTSTKATKHGTIIFTQFESYRKNASGSYINLHWNPSTDGDGIYVLDNAGCTSWNFNSVGSAPDAGCDDGTDYIQQGIDSGGSAYGYVNSDDGVNGSVPSAAGHNSSIRLPSDDNDFYHNGSVEITYNVPPTNVPNYDMYALNYNSMGIAGSVTNGRRQSLLMFHSGDIDQAEMYASLNTFINGVYAL